MRYKFIRPVLDSHNSINLTQKFVALGADNAYPFMHAYSNKIAFKNTVVDPCK